MTNRKRMFVVAIILSVAICGLSATGQKEKLTIGMMPAINSIPLIIAEHQGYFAAEGIEVELVMFKSQLYRETALQTDAIDGSISDLMNAINGRAAGFPLRVTSWSDGDFALMAAPGGRLRNLADWQAAAPGSIKTGLLENSIVYYATERILEASGASPDRIDLVSTLVVAARMEMLLAGQLDAACLPEPLATVAEKQGAIRLVDTGILADAPGVMVFTEKAIKNKAKSLQAFYRAYNRAVLDLNAGYDRFRDVIIQKGEFPPAIRDFFVLPTFRLAAVPDEAAYNDVINWMSGKKLLDTAVPYRSMIDASFLK